MTKDCGFGLVPIKEPGMILKGSLQGDDPESEVIRDENGDVISYVNWFTNHSYPKGCSSAEVKLRVWVKENRVEILEVKI